VLHLSEQGFVRAVAAHEGDVFFAFRGGEVAVQIALHLIAEAAEVAACAGAERPAGDIGFDQRVVTVAFSAAGIGEMAVADLVPAFLCQRFAGVGGGPDAWGDGVVGSSGGGGGPPPLDSLYTYG